MKRPAAILHSFPLLLLLLLSCGASAQEAAPERLKVIAAECPPFVINDGGELSGLGIFLWDSVAGEMGVEYDIELSPLGEMLKSISQPKEQRRANIGISCLSITAEREKFIDFSHSFFETYIGIAVKQRGLADAITGILKNPATLRVLAIFIALAGLVGAIFFLLERGINSKLYTMESRRGKLVEAFLVGTVFITRGPINFWEFQSLTARVMATVLALAATFLIAAVTALLASAFTLESLRSQVTGLHDLSRLRVGAMESSTSSAFLGKNGIPHRTIEDLVPLIDSLERGELDAVVSDAAVLKYTLQRGKAEGRYDSLAVLPYEFDPQLYGFALEPDSPYAEQINQALLTVRKREDWNNLVREYLGE
jgi:polar amino acid transport system substrate-binding protein